MGRKKIEIRPLTDERNRNVTFLKRKAGLMKKAWELSVLCAADVSILIFSAQGKAYEFSSKELDMEFDRYLDYEGMIERRRAEEFAAMALAGEDDDDDEDDNPRRESISKAGANGAPPPTKSLKGKETFKSRQPSRVEIGRAVAEAKERPKKQKKRSGGRKRRDDDSSSNGGGGRGRSFVDGLLSDPDSSEEEDERDRRKRRRDIPSEEQNGMAGLQYAMNMQQTQSAGQTLPDPDLGGFFAHSQPSLPSRPYRGGGGSAYGTSSNPYESWGTNGLSNSDPQYSFLGPHPGHPVPSYPPQPPHPGQTPGGPGGMQWNQDLIARYAEFQLQQNHQKQQRALLERQRVQLAEMGIPVDDRSLLDQIFGNSSSSSSNGHVGATHPQAGQSGGESGSLSSGGTGDTFEWPSLRRTDEGGMKDQMYGYASAGGEGTISGDGLGSGSRYPSGMSSSGVDDIPWGVGTIDGRSPEVIKRREDGGGGAGMGLGYGMVDDRRRMGLPL